MMRLAITGCGGVGKALINLLDSRRGALAAEGLDIQVNYVTKTALIFQPSLNSYRMRKI